MLMLMVKAISAFTYMPKLDSVEKEIMGFIKPNKDS